MAERCPGEAEHLVIFPLRNNAHHAIAKGEKQSWCHASLLRRMLGEVIADRTNTLDDTLISDVQASCLEKHLE